jgi:hypothetical protein
MILKLPPDLRITINDVMASGHCARGSRRWFHQYNLDFKDFLKNGIPAQTLLDTGDGLAEQIVRAKLNG